MLKISRQYSNIEKLFFIWYIFVGKITVKVNEQKNT